MFHSSNWSLTHRDYDAWPNVLVLKHLPLGQRAPLANEKPVNRAAVANGKLVVPRDWNGPTANSVTVHDQLATLTRRDVGTDLTVDVEILPGQTATRAQNDLVDNLAASMIWV